METKQKIEIIEKTLDNLNRLSVTGIRRCGIIYAAACDLERMLHVLRAEEAEERAAQADDEEDAE